MEDIYLREDLLEIYKYPASKGSLPDATVSVEDVNPMCGDEIKLDLKFDADKVLIDAKYSGEACAVSIISSELVLEELSGKSLSELKKLDKQAVLDLIGVPLTTSRIKCATLVLSAIKKAIVKYEAEFKS